ncbi:MAG: DUF3108 domain-containing protein [Pseudomonadota bacterium]
MTYFTRGLLWGALVLGCFPTFSWAADETGTFDVTIRGLRAGTLSYSANFTETAYAVSGAVRAAGIASVALDDARLDTEVTGRLSGNRYTPGTYREVNRRGGETITKTLAYSGGVPTATRNPPRNRAERYPVTNFDTRGSADPLTTAFAILRDRPTALACDLDINVFDGRRVSNLRMKTKQTTEDGEIVCQGEYRRKAGFSPDDLAEKPVWPFTVIYQDMGDSWRVNEVQVPTTFGRIRMRRR